MLETSLLPRGTGAGASEIDKHPELAAAALRAQLDRVPASSGEVTVDRAAAAAIIDAAATEGRSLLTEPEAPMLASDELDLEVYERWTDDLGTFGARRLDWILITRDGLDFEDYYVAEDEVSDHRAVIAEISVE